MDELDYKAEGIDGDMLGVAADATPGVWGDATDAAEETAVMHAFGHAKAGAYGNSLRPVASSKGADELLETDAASTGGDGVRSSGSCSSHCHVSLHNADLLGCAMDCGMISRRTAKVQNSVTAFAKRSNTCFNPRCSQPSLCGFQCVATIEIFHQGKLRQYVAKERHTSR